MSLAAVPPVMPDFHLCSSSYGTGIAAGDCYIASTMLVVGNILQLYAVNDPRRDFYVPFQAAHGRWWDSSRSVESDIGY